MKYAVLSDVHSNWEALSAALKEIGKSGVDYILYLGDTVGYNADPDKCTEKISEIADYIVRGNHDKAVAGLMGIDYFNSIARKAVLWTKNNTSTENLRVLRDFPAGPLLIKKRYLICHGSPMDEDRYIMSYLDIDESFKYMDSNFPSADICFFGHTHVPLIYEENTGLVKLRERVVLDPSKRYLINPGSVGQPRDHNPPGSFGIFDDKKYVYRYLRFSYPISITQDKIIRAGLPEELALRLNAGY